MLGTAFSHIICPKPIYAAMADQFLEVIKSAGLKIEQTESERAEALAAGPRPTQGVEETTKSASFPAEHAIPPAKDAE
jgi:hypothetical protein